MANDIKRYPVPLIFKKILKDELSGRLTVTSEGFHKEIFFVKGNMIFASTDVERERLGELLLTVGRISSEEFLKLSKIKQHSDRKVGEILVDITNLSRQDMYYALLYQVKTIAVSTFPLTEGEWSFTKTTPKIPGGHKFRIKIPEIIREGVKKIDKISYYKQRFYYRAPVTTSVPEDLNKYLSSDEVKFYLRLVSFTNTSVEQILQKSVAPKSFFWRSMILLYLLNIVDFVEYTVDRELNKNIEEINEMYGRIKGSRVNYYHLLGLPDSAPIETVKASYFKFSEKYHPDRIQVAPDSTAKIKATEVFAEINRAFEVLSNKEKKSDYDVRGRNPEEPPTPATSGEKVKQARQLYLKANALYKKKHYPQAAGVMEEAVRLDDKKPSFFLLLGLCQAKSAETVKSAEQNLKKASEMEPWNADPVFALGELYRSENFLKKADHHFKKALELNLDHTLAGKAIKDLEELYMPKKKFSLFGKKK